MNISDFKTEYETLHSQFRQMSAEERMAGFWLVPLIYWVLRNYAAKVDVDYIRHKYPGVGATNQAKKAIRLASAYASIAGGISAAAVTTLELSIPASGGLDAAIAIPAIGASILADVALTTGIQLRSTYDLSVIHDAPLSVDDAEDCLFIFAASLGVQIAEKLGDFAKAIGPKLIAYNVRKLLQSGLRSALAKALQKIAGTQLAKKLTERAMMRVLVPGISIPISASANYFFTRSFLKRANSFMATRGAVMRPLIQFHHFAPGVERDLAMRAFIVVMEAPARQDGWSEEQLQAFRQTQRFVCLDDEMAKRLDCWFERAPEQVAAATNGIANEARQSLANYLVVGAALGLPEHDAQYAQAIAIIGQLSVDAVPDIDKQRRILASA